MNNRKIRLLSIVIALIMTINLLPISAHAKADDAATWEIEYPDQYEALSSIEHLKTIVDIDALTAYLFEAFYECRPSIDLTAFNIDYTTENLTALSDLIYKEKAEFFHIKSYVRWQSAGKLLKIEPTYSVSAAEYQKMYAQILKAADKLLQKSLGDTLSNRGGSPNPELVFPRMPK